MFNVNYSKNAILILFNYLLFLTFFPSQSSKTLGAIYIIFDANLIFFLKEIQYFLFLKS